MIRDDLWKVGYDFPGAMWQRTEVRSLLSQKWSHHGFSSFSPLTEAMSRCSFLKVRISVDFFQTAHPGWAALPPLLLRGREGGKAVDYGILGVLIIWEKHTAIAVSVGRRGEIFLVGRGRTFLWRSQIFSTRNPWNGSALSFCARRKVFLLTQM